MALVVVVVPHTREQHFSIGLEIVFHAAIDLHVLIALAGIFHRIFDVRIVLINILLCYGKMRAVQQRGAAILFTTQVFDQTDRVVDIVHVNGRIRIGADQGGEIHEVAQHHECIAPKSQFE